ncbi:hypothetical protein ACFP56_14215 [Paenibacillus septentrionalis]|uniref:Uncharacterized protein n=1 Tax=Paenibacillus septentrionalis TaxID=429342 RepID=A0ABW1V4S9_9BACL
MKTWKKVTIWIASILVVLVVGGLFAANYAVDKVLDSMVGMSVDDLMGEEDGALDVQPDDTVSVPDEPSDATDPNESTDSDEQDSANAGQGTQADDTDQKSNSNSGQSSSSNGGGQNSSTGSNGGSDTPAATPKPTPGNSSGGYTPEISTDKAKEVEENITVGEKAKVVTTLMGSLSASDISTLQKLASGGLSVEEKKEARAILLEKLSEDQYNDLIAIAAKHGLSQGRSYSEVKDE